MADRAIVRRKIHKSANNDPENTTQEERLSHIKFLLVAYVV